LGLGFLGGASGKDLRDAVSIPGLGRSPGGGQSNPFHYSGQENPMDRGAQGAILNYFIKDFPIVTYRCLLVSM